MNNLSPEEAQKHVDRIQSRIRGIRENSYKLHSQVPMYLESRAGKLMQEMRESLFYTCRDINYFLAVLGYDESVRFETEDDDMIIEPVYEKEEDEKTLLLSCNEYREKQRKAIGDMLAKEYNYAQDVTEAARLSRDIDTGRVLLRCKQKTDELEVWYERSAEEV